MIIKCIPMYSRHRELGTSWGIPVHLQKCIYVCVLGRAGSLLCGLFSSCGKQGYSLAVVRRLFDALAASAAEHRLWGARAAVVAALGSGAQARELWGMRLIAVRSSQTRDRGRVSWLCLFTTEPLPDSLPLSHQGSPQSNSTFLDRSSYVKQNYISLDSILSHAPTGNKSISSYKTVFQRLW